MKKVANCFMSLGSVSRARAMFNSVMAKNSSRVVLIALVMLVCGSGSLFAQDTITISVVSGSTRYYFADNGNGTITNPSTNLTSNCLWVIQKQGNTGNQYTFKNVGTSRWLRYGNNSFSLQTNENQRTACVLSTAFTSPSTEATLRGSTNNGRYLRYRNNAWTNTTSNNATSLTFESWTRKENKGGLKGSFEPSEDIEFKNFDKTDAEARKHKSSVNFVITRTAASTYYQCVNRADAKISISSGTQNNTPINLSMLSVSWQLTSNSTTSKANCSNYETSPRNSEISRPSEHWALIAHL